jgi:heme A synthase
MLPPRARPAPHPQRSFPVNATPRPTPVARYAWAVLAWNVLVVLWGALVRATGSGAGCGRHWPVCNGEVIPRSPSLTTLIELSHRAMTGVDTVLVVVLVLLAWRLYPRGSMVRLGAGLTLLLLVSEALVGAGLVLRELVAENRSTERIGWMMLHLVNTFALLAALTLTAWWASGGSPLRLRRQGAAAWLALGALAATLLVAATGAVTALGDTLYPKTRVGLHENGAALLERLRVVHPLAALATGLLVVLAGFAVRRARPGTPTARLSRLLSGLFIAQVLAGVVNILLLAPVWMQLLHLLLADTVWITLVCTAAAALAAPGAGRAGAAPRSEAAYAEAARA